MSMGGERLPHLGFHVFDLRASQDYSKRSPNVRFLVRLEKTHLQQFSIPIHVHKHLGEGGAQTPFSF
jgi:hypothetical protein